MAAMLVLLAVGATCLSSCRGQDLPASELGGRAACETDSPALALLQRSASAAKASRSGTGMNTSTGMQEGLGRPGLFGNLLRAAAQVAVRSLDKVDCSKAPALCSELLRCDTEPVTLDEMLRMMGQIATDDGHAGLRLWCLDAGGFYSNNVVQQCLVNHDLMASARLTYDFQVSHGVGDADASYCFSEDYCGNTEVTPDTTLEQAEALCDKRYPEWRTMGLQDMLGGFLKPDVLTNFVLDMELQQGIPLEATHLFALASCAMGNYHCDVMYCKETYCQMDGFKLKYGHLLPKRS